MRDDMRGDWDDIREEFHDFRDDFQEDFSGVFGVLNRPGDLIRSVQSIRKTIIQGKKRSNG